MPLADSLVGLGGLKAHAPTVGDVVFMVAVVVAFVLAWRWYRG